MAYLIVVTGAPASGKTTLSASLARRLHLPLIARDEIKEAMLDSLSARDRSESQAIGAASYEVMYRQIARFAEAVTDFIVESNFSRGRADSELDRVLRGTGAKVIQIHCTATVDVIERRIRRRTSDRGRHSGHFDQDALPDILDRISRGVYLPLDCDGPLFILDTTAPETDAFDEVCAWLSAQMK